MKGSVGRNRIAKKSVVVLLIVGCLALSFGASAYGAYGIFGQAQQRADAKAAAEAAKAMDPYDLGFIVEDSEKDLEIETYQQGTVLNYLYMFGSDYYDMYFDHPAGEVTVEGLKAIVGRNGGIPEEFKGRVCEFVEAVAETYPGIDLRVLEHNLASIEIEDCDASEVWSECNIYTAGYYSVRDNKICITSGNGYAKYTWDYQVLPHELCHAMRRMRAQDGELDVHVHPQAWQIEVVDEAFTSIMAGELLGYDADELCYQPEVNMVRVMLECVDGYEFDDYYRQSLQYFAAKLDETCGDNNYAMAIFRLMQAQHDDYFDPEVCRDRAAYHPIYDYLTRMYLDEHAYAGMHPGVVDRLITELVERVTYGVPDDYGVNVGEFYRFGQEYYEETFGAEDGDGLQAASSDDSAIA